MKPPNAKQEAVYFMAWIDRMTAAADKNETGTLPRKNQAS